MKNTILYISLILLLSSCSKKTLSYVETMQKYQNDKIEAYKQNEQLNLKPEEINDYFPINETLNLVCDFEESPKPYSLISFATSSNQKTKYAILGIANCKIEGNPYELTVYAPTKVMPGKDYLFLPITDLTSGESTYGGGRYLELFRSDIKGDSIHIDFNKLYNPYCAFRTGFSCPIPPLENHINVKIEAGEMYKN